MRIVNRKEFLAMPSGTVYCKYSSMGNLGDLCIKMDSERLTDDWYYQFVYEFDDCESSEEMFDKLAKMEGSSSVSFPLNCDTGARDGFFEDEQLFMVYDDSDVMRMINLLINTTK